MNAQIVEGPGYRPDGKGGIVVLGEFGRNITIACTSCAGRRDLRLCADEVLTDDECDALLDEYLRGKDWLISDRGDFCRSCATQFAPGSC